MTASTTVRLLSERAAAQLQLSKSRDAETSKLLQYRIDEIDRELLARREEAPR